MSRNPLLLQQSRSGLLVIDIQEKLYAAMANKELFLKNAIILIKSFQILERPVFLTEQYPEGLGTTLKQIKKLLSDTEVKEKLHFSCDTLKGLTNTFRTKKIDQIILCGIEAHICVWQTAMDLTCQGFSVTVARDAISSRNETDMITVLKRMTNHGIHVSTTEMILFELMEKAGTDLFKAITKLVK